MRRLRLLAWVAVAALAGCTDEVAPFSTVGKTVVSPAGLMLTSGLKRVQVRLPQREGQAPLPFATAQVLANGETVIMSADTFDAQGLGAVAIVSPLQAGDPVAVFLRDAAGRLVASGVQSVASSSSELPLNLVTNTGQARIIRALDDNNVADNVVIRVSPLEMDSGYLDAQPGVDHVDIEVSGLAYGDRREVAKLGTLKAPDLATYQWQAGISSGSYDPKKLSEPGTPQPFFVTTRAFDVAGNEVGVTTIKIAIVGTAFVNVGLDQGDM